MKKNIVGMMVGLLCTITSVYATNIGDQAFGGTVIYVNSTGDHGLVSANNDQVQKSWAYMIDNLVSDPKNFNDQPGKTYTDWHVPTLYQLQTMCDAAVNKKVFASGTAPAGRYWSATADSNEGRIWVVEFDKNCATTTINNDGQSYDLSNVRAVRSF